MNHVTERLQFRFGISDLSVPKLKYYTKDYGELLFRDKDGAEFHRLRYQGKILYPVVRDGRIVTVYWSSYVSKKIIALFGYNPKKKNKMLKKMRGE